MKITGSEPQRVQRKGVMVIKGENWDQNGEIKGNKTTGEQDQEVSKSKLPYSLTLHKNNKRKGLVKSEKAFLNLATF